MHIAMALLLNICKYKGCAQIFQTLIDLIHHIEETHIIALVPLPERSQPACIPLSCILPYNPPCETVAPAVGASAAVNGASDPAHRSKSGAATVWASAALGATMTSVGGNATNNQPAEMLTGNSATATTNAVNGSGHGMPGVSANGTGEQNGLGGASGTPSETSKTTTINQPTGTADLKRKIAIKHHSYSISSSNRSTTPTGSELDDDDMMVSESEDSNDSWTTEEFSSEFIMRYGSRRHSSSGAGNGPNSSNEKPFACPVPGCKKRYKNVNGIKYHSKNGHKKDGNRVRKGFKCFCGKSYKTNQRLKIHNMLSHGPGWANATAAGSVVSAAAANASSTTVSGGSGAVAPAASAAASESEVAVTGFETISLASSVSLPAPAVPSQPASSRGTSANPTSSVTIASTWDSSSFTIDFPTGETSGIAACLTGEQDHHGPDQANPTGQTERSCSSTSNSNGSNSSVGSNSTSGISNCGSIASVTSGGGGIGSISTSGIGSTGRSFGLAASSYNSSLNSNVYPTSARFSHIAGGPSTIASSQNGTNASNTTTSPPPLPPPTATLASATSSGQASFTIAAQATTKRTLPSSSTPSTTAAATLVISSLQPSHGIGSGGCFVTSTPMSSPVSIKYDSLGILTPATSPKLIAANIGQESGQQQQQQLLLTAAGGGSTSAVAVASPLPPAQCPPVAMPPALNATGITVAAVPASAAAAAAATGVGEPVGIALVVSSIGGCGELGSATTVTTTATTSTNNAVVLPASSATSQLYAEET
uniref:C2H2-type domain-containing protein n=1 Tax=Anopheles atroparvus TaxID=41427 RepID=A0AAG5DVJ1_ANOAO